MHISIGDLVLSRNHGKKIGIVVDKRISNEGLTSSMHVRHMINSYPQVFYVYFSEEGRVGPLHETDLFLQQSCQMESSIVR
jgi:hypothetical protein